MRPRDLLVLFLAALVARTAAAVIVGDAPYLDAAYYELVARRLTGGDGFTVPVVWSFLATGGQLPDPAVLPIDSNRHWMPLTSLFGAASMSVFGTSRLAGQVPMIALGALLVPATAQVTWELWRNRRTALIAGVLALFAGPMLVYAPQLDSFAVFGVAGFGALYAAMRAVRTPAPGRAGAWLVASGALVGVATLARIDGVLLLVAPVTAWGVRRVDGSLRLPPLAAWWLAIAALAGIAVLAPWLARQLATFGSPFPSAGGATLWITSYNDQFSISRPHSLESYLDWGIPAILGSKLQSWAVLLGRTATLLGGIFIASFLVGLWRERRRPELLPFTAYWIAMFAAMGGLFTFHAPQGAFYHSALAWLPLAIGLSVAAFEPMLDAVGSRIALFGRQRNQRFLLHAGVAGALVLSIVGSAALIRGWADDRGRLERAAGFFADPSRSGDVVMYVDPPSLFLESGNPSVAPPYDPFPVIGQVVEAYGVQWLVLERASGAATDPLGLWEGAASVDALGNAATWLAADPAFEADGVRIFEVHP